MRIDITNKQNSNRVAEVNKAILTMSNKELRDYINKMNPDEIESNEAIEYNGEEVV